jgi:hypothetical protein
MKIRPIQAKSTERIISAILPQEFKITNDKMSNGYKFINLAVGVEVDEADRALQEVYDNSFISTIDLSSAYDIYDVYLSGIPHSEYLVDNDSSATPIKIVDYYEFTYGAPTRLIYVPPSGDSSLYEFNLYSGIPSGEGNVGLEYFRDTYRGSGYLLITNNIEQKTAYNSGIYPVFKANIDEFGIINNWSGLYPGIGIQNFANKAVDEVLTPETSGLLRKKYPTHRKEIDRSGVSHYIVILCLYCIRY